MSATQTPLTDEMVDQWQREASRHVEETLAQSDDWHFVYDRKVAKLAAATTPPVQDSIPMILHCPACHAQHIDAPESEDWTNPPHRSHLCHTCGHIWRPADVPTTGVAKIETRGKNDSLPVQEAQIDAAAAEIARLRSESATQSERLDALKAEKDVLQSMAHRLALDLECLLLSTDNPAATKWWNESNATLQAWREMKNDGLLAEIAKE